mgnify:CR=1 FL=1
MTVTSSKPAPDALSTPDPSESQHAEAIANRVKAQTAQPVELQPLGLATGTSGNLSVRTGDGMLITPSGIAYDTLFPALGQGGAHLGQRSMRG